MPHCVWKFYYDFLSVKLTNQQCWLCTAKSKHRKQHEKALFIFDDMLSYSWICIRLLCFTRYTFSFLVFLFFLFTYCFAFAGKIFAFLILLLSRADRLIGVVFISYRCYEITSHKWFIVAQIRINYLRISFIDLNMCAQRISSHIKLVWY